MGIVKNWTQTHAIHRKTIEMSHIILFSLIYSKWGICLKNKEGEIIELLKLDIGNWQYAIILILYKLLHFVIIIRIKHALQPCQTI